MPSKHPFLVAAACALPLSIAACGGGSDGPITPEGTHHGYVVSKLSVPTTTGQVTEFGLDLGGKTSSDPDKAVDNKLGMLLQTVGGLGVAVQPAIDSAVDKGSVLLLVDFQTKDFTNADASGFAVKLGASSTPPACTDANDTVCRHHLDGNASFTLSPSSPTDALVAGKIASGTFNGGPGDIPIQLSLGTSTLSLNLLNARVRASSISESGIMTANIGGLVTPGELMTQLGPVIEAQVAAILGPACPGVPGNCQCKGSIAELLITYDTDQNCKLSAAEIFASSVVKGFLTPDVCSKDSCKDPDAISLGVQIKAVKATFPM